MKIIGQMVCGAGEADRWLEESLKEFKRLCDDALVVTCNVTKKEKDLINQYGFKTYEDNREWGIFQPYIKTELLKRIATLGADWVLALDADETVPTLSRSDLESLSKGRESCQLYVANLWNDELHYSEELSFWNVRFYKVPSEGNRQFTRKAVHCGNAPPVAYSQSARDSYVPHILLHKGLMREEDRQRKIERYRVYDPNAVHKGQEYYDALGRTGEGRIYNQDDVIRRLQSYCTNLQPKPRATKTMQEPRKFYYVRRDDEKHRGSVVEIPHASLAITLKQHPRWKVMDETIEEVTEATIKNAPISDPLDCPICGFHAASNAGASAHKRIRHP